MAKIGVVLKTIELTQHQFDQVDEAFAYDEGEGDRSLAYWREAHKRYFTRLGLFEPQMMLWCERFPVEHVVFIGRSGKRTLPIETHITFLEMSAVG